MSKKTKVTDFGLRVGDTLRIKTKADKLTNAEGITPEVAKVLAPEGGKGKKKLFGLLKRK